MKAVKYFNGYRFVEQNTGYLATRIDGKLVLLHRYIWELHFGAIPDGCVIHHKDGNKLNNNLDNLECLSRSRHSAHHGKNKSPDRLQRDIENLAKARPKAAEWHKSEAGRECSRRNAKILIERGVLNPTTLYTCENCGKQFIGVKRKAKHKFCSGACEQYFRRHNGLNDEKRICIICNREFITDKYEKTKTCSRSCAMKLAHINNPTNWRTGE